MDETPCWVLYRAATLEEKEPIICLAEYAKALEARYPDENIVLSKRFNIKEFFVFYNDWRKHK